MDIILYRNRWLYFLRGLILIVLGISALFFPSITFVSLIMFFGAFAFVSGIFGLVDSLFSRKRNFYWADGLIEGVLGILIGFLVFFYPIITTEVFLLVLIFWAFFSGIFELVQGLRYLTSTRYAFIPIINGILSIAFALFFFFYPELLIPAFGIYAILFGLMLLIFSLMTKGKEVIVF